MKAHCTGFKFKLDNGLRDLGAGAVQPGVSYVITVQRTTKSFYTYIMVNRRPLPANLCVN